MTAGDTTTRRALQGRLLAWYRAERRDLPWRATRDPYAIWISEAMLQQTRVETVRDYWRRFLARFPDVRALAASREEDVLAAWSGLGYYSRARNLRAAARAIVERHAGALPTDEKELLALPGIGPYTAGALRSIAFDQPAALVDGNVERVFARLFGLELSARSPELVRTCWDLARDLVERSGAPSDWNQALMELGALVCTPRRPACERCPVSGSCAARRTGRAERLPLRREKPATLAVELEILCVEKDARFLLEQRPRDGRMAGLWQFPTRESSGTGLFPPDFRAGLGPHSSGETIFELRHSITKHRVRARLLRGVGASAGPAVAWLDSEGVDGAALTGMAKKVWRRMRN